MNKNAILGLICSLIASTASWGAGCEQWEIVQLDFLYGEDDNTTAFYLSYQPDHSEPVYLYGFGAPKSLSHTEQPMDVLQKFNGEAGEYQIKETTTTHLNLYLVSSPEPLTGQFVEMQIIPPMKKNRGGTSNVIETQEVQSSTKGNTKVKTRGATDSQAQLIPSKIPFLPKLGKNVRVCQILGATSAVIKTQEKVQSSTESETWVETHGTTDSQTQLTGTIPNLSKLD